MASSRTNNPKTVERTKCYRVINILASWSQQELQDTLASDLDLGQQAVEVASLAPDPRTISRRTATCYFSLQCSITDGKLKEWNAILVRKYGYEAAMMIDSNFMGFTPYSAIPLNGDFTLDIIAVPGLDSHAFGTFKEPAQKYMWLRDTLPKVFPNARIMTYGYESTLQNSSSTDDLETIANPFLKTLRGVRNESSRPLIFIGVSMGGLIIKQAIWKSRDSLRGDLMINSIRGLVFFGVPNQGMKNDHLRAIVKGHANKQLIRDLGIDSRFLRDQHAGFCKSMADRAKIYSFFETKLTPLTVEKEGKLDLGDEKDLLVPRMSATHGRWFWELDGDFVQPINKPHHHLARFGPLEDGLNNVVDVVKGLASEEAEHNPALAHKTLEARFQRLRQSS